MIAAQVPDARLVAGGADVGLKPPHSCGRTVDVSQDLGGPVVHPAVSTR